MNLDWKEYIGKTLNVTMHENYGLTFDTKADATIYEIVLNQAN